MLVINTWLLAVEPTDETFLFGDAAQASPQVSWLFFKARATSISRSIRKERATRKNSQPAAARRVALKMGRRLRCSSFTYRFRYAPSTAGRLGPLCRRPILKWSQSLTTKNSTFTDSNCRLVPGLPIFSKRFRNRRSHTGASCLITVGISSTRARARARGTSRFAPAPT